MLIGSPLAGSEIRSRRLFPDFAAALGDREIVRYVVAYAGNLWEVFAVRAWFVPILTFNATSKFSFGSNYTTLLTKYTYSA